MHSTQNRLGGAAALAGSGPDRVRRRLMLASALGAGATLIGCGGGGGGDAPPPVRTFDATLVYGASGSSGQQLYLYRPGATPFALAANLTGGVEYFELTPDRRAVVCVARENASARSALYRIDLTAPFAVVRLSPTSAGNVGSVRVFRISPDGARVAFTGDLNTLNVVEVYVVQTAGGGFARVNGPVGSPPTVELDLPFPQAWSPNGRYLLQGVRELASGRRIGLNVYELNAGANSTRITAPLTPANARIGEARWLPDSSGVVYAAHARLPTIQEPILVRLAQPQVTNFLISSAVVGAEAIDIGFAPDSRTVYYRGRFSSSNRTDLYAVPLTASAGGAGGPVQLGGPRTVNNSLGVTGYALSPTGARIAYTSDEQSVGSPQLLEISASATPGAAATVLNGPLATGASVSGFAYTPTGNAVLYRAGSAEYDLFLVNTTTPARPQRVNAAGVSGGGVDLDFVSSGAPSGLAAVYAGDLLTDNTRELFFSFLDDVGRSTRLNAPLNAGSRVQGFSVR
jgi:hypothetical protein